MENIIQDEIIKRIPIEEQRDFVVKGFDSESEALKRVNYLNSMHFDDEHKGKYKFEVMQFKQNDIDNIKKANGFLEKDAINTAGGYYIAAVDAHKGVGHRNFNVNAPMVLQTPDGNLAFSQANFAVNARVDKKTAKKQGSNIFSDYRDRYEIVKTKKMDFILPDPFNNERILTGFDGGKRITHPFLRIGSNGSQEIMNADYPSFVKQIMEYTSSAYYSARTGIGDLDDVKYQMAKSTAYGGLSGITGKTSTDIGTLSQIKGTQGMTMGGKGSYSKREIVLDHSLARDYDPEVFDNIESWLAKQESGNIVKEGSIKNISYFFDKGGDIEKIGVHRNHEIGESITYVPKHVYKDAASRTKFNEFFNDTVSKVRNFATLKSNSEETYDAINKIVESYTKAAKSFQKTEEKVMLNPDEYVKKIHSIIKAGFKQKAKLGEGATNKMAGLFKEDGALSIAAVKAMVVNGVTFSDLVDVNRQSINTTDTTTQHTGAIMHSSGSINKGGQRNAQADAIMSKAVLEIDGEEVNLSSIAKGWSSDISEFSYKKLSAENAVADQLIGGAQELIYGKKLASSYFSQQNYILQTFHDGAFQDSNMMAADLTLENISKYDDKNTLFVPYNAMKSEAMGGDLGDLSKLSSENSLVEGTTENKIFRALLGEENYNKHIQMKANIVNEYRQIGENFEGITSLQTVAEREAYALANNNAILQTNDIHEKYFVAADSKARASIIDKNVVSSGQATNLTGINYASIDGIDFTPDGARIKTTGIINHGDSVKFMIDAVKSTTQSVQLSMGMNLSDGTYLPLSGLNSEKMKSGKRGFTGELLSRSMTTMAFNHTTLGNSDNLEENFNSWKKLMETDFSVEMNGKKVSIFEATGLDIKFSNDAFTFINRDTQEAISGYDFKTKKMTGSVNSKIHGAIEDRVSNLFGINIFNNDGKDYTKILFEKMLGKAENELPSLLKGNTGGLSEKTRQNMARLFVDGTLETIGVSNGSGVVNDLGWLKGIKLMTNVHIMQETKSRADADGLSISRLSQMILREGQMFDIADDIEEETAYRAYHTGRKYFALTGTYGYDDISTKGTNGYNIFSSNVVDMKSSSLRYNIDGTNTTLENFMKKSSLGKLVEDNFDFEKGKLKKTTAGKFADATDVLAENAMAGKLVGFNSQFLDGVKSFSGKDGTSARAGAIRALVVSDISEFLSKDEKLNLVFKELGNDVLGNDMRILDKSDISDFRTKTLISHLENGDVFQNNSLSKGLGIYGASQKDTVTMMKTLIASDFDMKVTRAKLTELSQKKRFSEGSMSDLGKVNNLLKKYDRQMDSFVNGEKAYSGEWTPGQKIGNVEFTSTERHLASKLINATQEAGANGLDDFGSRSNLIKMYTDRIADYSGENIFNLKALQEIEGTDQLRFIIDEISTDNNGMIISKSNLTNIEKLIKQNSDLDTINKKIESVTELEASNLENRTILNKVKTDAKSYLSTTGLDEDRLKRGNDFIDERVDKLLKSNYMSRDKLDAASVDRKLDAILDLSDSKLKGYTGVAELDIKIAEINKLKNETIDDVFNAILEMGEGSSHVKNSAVGLLSQGDGKYHGSVFENVYQTVKNIQANPGDSKVKDLGVFRRSLLGINQAIDLGKSGQDKYGVNTMVNEKNAINDVINKALGKFYDTIDFGGDVQELNENIKAFSSAYAKGFDDSPESTKHIFNIIKDSLSDGGVTDINRAVAAEMSSSIIAKTMKNGELDSLMRERNALKLNMIDTVKNVTSDLSKTFFKKGGAAPTMATMRFKNSVEFSPTEKTVVSSYISDEFRKVMGGRIDGTSSKADHDDLFRSLKLLYGKEIANDIYGDYSKALNGAELKDKEAVVEAFRKNLKNKLNDLSGIVVGTREDYINAGLGNLIDKKGPGSLAINGFLSRNPHQYIGSMRATRYVVLDENDRNSSFFKGMFGDTAKVSNTQGNLSLIGKRTAIAAHGDHDGDKFQAMFMTEDDFKYKSKTMSKAEIKDYLKKKDIEMDMYRLLGDYNGNLKEASTRGTQSFVEKGIFEKARKVHGMSDATDAQVFEKIKKQYWALRAEYRRTSAEIIDEELSHAEVAYYKVARNVTEKDNAKAFEAVVDKLSNENKLAVLTNTFDYDDMNKLDTFFDKETLKDEGFRQILDKVKKIAKNKDDAELLVREFGMYGADKIKWNNAALSDSSFAAYTGIARTGVVHAPLTNIRDSAASMFSKERTSMLLESIAIRQSNADINIIEADSLKSLLNSYTETNKFMTTTNNLGTLIEKLAISAKLSDGSNPYSVIKNFKETNNALNRQVEVFFREQKEAHKAFKFDTLEKTYEYLSDNQNDAFSFNKFQKTYGKGFLFSNDKKISGILEEHMAKVLFPKHFKDSKTTPLKMLLANSALIKETKLTNDGFLKVMSNTYAMIGSSVLNVVSGINEDISTDDLLDPKKNIKMKSAYSDGRNAFIGEDKNIYHNMTKVESDDLTKNGYNPEIGIYHKIKKFFKDFRTSDVSSGGDGGIDGGIEEIATPKAMDTGAEGIEVKSNSATNVVEGKTAQAVLEPELKNAEAEAMDDLVKNAKHSNIEEDSVVNLNIKSVQVKTTIAGDTTEAAEEAVQEIVKNKRGRPKKQKAIEEVKPKNKRGRPKKQKSIETTADESADMIEESIPETEATKIVKKTKAKAKKKTVKVPEVNPDQMKLDFSAPVQETTTAKAEEVLTKTDEITTAKLKEAEEQIVKMESETKKLQSALEGKEKEVEVIRAETEALQNAVGDKDKEINSIQNEAKSLQAAISEKDKELTDIQSEISSVKNKLDEGEKSLSDAKDEIAKLTTKFDEINAEKSKLMQESAKNIEAERKAASAAKKKVFDIEAEHKKALNNLNSVHQKAVEARDTKIKELTEKLARLNAKVESSISEVSELKSALKTASGIKGGAKSAYKEVSEQLSGVGENAKKIYNMNKKMTIGAASTAVLGMAFSLLQGSRPIVDVDMRQKDFEQQNGSMYQNLGSYGINTNIRGIK